MRTGRALCCSLLAALLLALVPATAGGAPPTREVLVVGNNWDGTADVIDGRTFKRLTRLNIIPDYNQRIAEIMSDPPAQGYFTGINLLIGEGHNQYVDDAFTSHDGRYLYVSRPSFKDVVGFDLSTRRIIWRFQVGGYRADHMGISPDGRRLLVSASTANKVHVIDTATGRSAGEFESGDSPHENNYSSDGRRIFHASIGMVYTPADDPAFDSTKGKRYFQIVDARSLRILKRLDMGQKLEEAGYPNMSSAVRPMALSPDERYLYFQVSFFHGFVEYDLRRDRVLRLARLPLSEKAKKLRRDEYVLDSAHHGIAMSPAGNKLCVAGTMSDYAAVVSRSTFGYRIAAHGGKPYWVTNSGNGRYCFVSFSGDDRVSVVSYALQREIASVPVGDHPQRMRVGRVQCAYLGRGVDCVAPRLAIKVKRRKHARRRLRVRVSEASRVRIVVARAKRGRRRDGRCRPASKRLTKKRWCRRWAKVRVLRRRAHKGRNRYSLGKLRLRRRYRVDVRATDAAGNRSPKKVARFRLRRR
jgi:DNA-binding beta-propeller fold protein YncE